MAVSLDQLRTIGRSIDPSQQVQSNEVAPVLSALIYHQQHGQALEDAAEKSPQEVSNLLADAERHDAIERAQRQQTQVEHHPAEADDDDADAKSKGKAKR